MNVVDEHIIIQNILNGDVQAFEKIVLHYQDMVYTLSYRILKNREEAEEIAQDVFIKVYSSLGGFNSKSKLSTWIYRITYNTAINRFRSVKRKIETVEINDTTEYNFETKPDAFINIIEKENKKIINDSILKLPESDRIIITLYYYDELSIAEIADIIGITKQNVKIKLFRSRQKLYDELKDKVDQEIIAYEYN